jgi:hypothetical protein
MKDIYESEIFIDQERHIALEISISRMTHDERERENTPAK